MSKTAEKMLPANIIEKEALNGGILLDINSALGKRSVEETSRVLKDQRELWRQLINPKKYMVSPLTTPKMHDVGNDFNNGFPVMTPEPVDALKEQAELERQRNNLIAILPKMQKLPEFHREDLDIQLRDINIKLAKLCGEDTVSKRVDAALLELSRMRFGLAKSLLEKGQSPELIQEIRKEIIIVSGEIDKHKKQEQSQPH
jgi:hypothetical protein